MVGGGGVPWFVCVEDGCRYRGGMVWAVVWRRRALVGFEGMLNDVEEAVVWDVWDVLDGWMAGSVCAECRSLQAFCFESVCFL